MRILFFCHYFPPEVNAPASRTYENSKRWVRQGHQVTVLTCAPNCPDGIVYEGHKNKLFQTEVVDGIKVVRVWTFIAANKGTYLRIANYLSYMFSAIFFSLFLPRPDVIIATSPQFFCGWAGLISSRLRRIRFILEVRDIMPESIVAVMAIKKPFIVNMLSRMDDWMNAGANLIVTVGEGYRRMLIKKGVDEDKILVIPNGVDRELFALREPDLKLKKQLGLNDKFICSWIGTIGLTSGLTVVLRAAELLKKSNNNDVAFLLVGDGAIREEMESEAQRRNLDNVVFTGRQKKEMMANYLSISDACLVHLRKAELFKTVIPSKIFECMAMKRPLIIAVPGSAEELVLRAGAGIAIEQENEEAILDAVFKMVGDSDMCRKMGESGRDFVLRHHDRDNLAQEYLDILLQAQPSEFLRNPLGN
jgi:glycosyltransferase involved in cell wall biosynthesis